MSLRQTPEVRVDRHKLLNSLNSSSRAIEIADELVTYVAPFWRARVIKLLSDFWELARTNTPEGEL